MGAWYRANATFKIPISDKKIAIPALLIIAPNDAFSPIELARRSSSFLKNDDIMEFESRSHWVIQEKPALIG